MISHGHSIGQGTGRTRVIHREWQRFTREEVSMTIEARMATTTVHAAKIADGDTWLPSVLLFASVLFNPLLAIVNGNIVALTPGPVVFSEIIIVGIAHIAIVREWRPQMASWYALIAILVSIAVLRSAVIGQPELKALRDVLLIPTFVMLGMASGEKRLTPVVVTIHVMVLALLVLEWIDVDLYARVFRVKDYYINTRGYVADEFTNATSELYVSADRPEERVFKFIQAHRMSSLFLEPVSLGNYCIIITAFLCAYRHRLSTSVWLFLAGGNFVVLVGCDGRLAIISILFIVGMTGVAMRLPRRINVLYLPISVTLTVILIDLFNFRTGTDDFQGRLAYTVQLLSNLRAEDLLGISIEFLPFAVDSGIAYIIITQSIFGLTILWLAIILLNQEHTREGVIYGHAVCIYLAFTMLVSYAFLSIKTSALLWFLMGTFQAKKVHRQYPR